MVLDPLKCTWMPFLLQVLFEFFLLIPVCREPLCNVFVLVAVVEAGSIALGGVGILLVC